MIDIKLEVFHSSTVDYIVLCINIFSRNFNVFSVVSQKKRNFWVGYFMVFNATFNNISVITWWSVLLMEETRVPGENH
jgi:hypothetical protein